MQVLGPKTVIRVQIDLRDHCTAPWTVTVALGVGYNPSRNGSYRQGPRDRCRREV